MLFRSEWSIEEERFEKMEINKHFEDERVEQMEINKLFEDEDQLL